MFNKKEYEMAVEAKKMINTLLSEGYEIENIAEAIYWFRWWDPRKGINEYAMNIAALRLYEVADNGQWWTPSTEKVLYMYRRTKKDLSKKRKIYSTYITADSYGIIYEKIEIV